MISKRRRRDARSAFTPPQYADHKEEPRQRAEESGPTAQHLGECKDRVVASDAIEVRPAVDADRRLLALLFAAVAEERDGIAAEPPIDVEDRASSWRLDGTLVALAVGEIVGQLHVEQSRLGFGEIGMIVAADWRGRGVGTALVAAAIDWARAHGLHKLTLSVFPHNDAAIALYRKFGFEEEGRREKQVRRANGELWDLIEMGLLL
jgi:RimJ/RimL family protein N-acetyltransferase